METKPLPKIEAIDPPAALWNRGGSATFYRVTSAPGVRMDGILAVSMSSHEPHYYEGSRRTTMHAPSVYVELCPTFADESGGRGRGDMPVTINGKEYNPLIGYARAEFLPDSYPHYPRATVGGREWAISSSVGSYDAWTDAARELIYRVIEAIAAEYVTDERWHAQRLSDADYAVNRATDEADKANAALADAIAARDAIKAER